MNLYEDAAQNWAEDEAREEIRFFQENLADGNSREESLEILARSMAKMKTIFNNDQDYSRYVSFIRAEIGEVDC
jgi:hypothetical protein